MIIKKILNTNVVISADDDGNEIIVMGCGLAFNKKRGQPIDEEKIERIFTQDIQEMTVKFKKIISEIPVEYMELAEKIIKTAIMKLGKQLNDEVYISLTDHIYFAIKRYRDGLAIENRLLLEIKHLYQDEFLIGKEAVNKINKVFQLNLPEDEAGFIALHIVNAELNEDIDHVMSMTKIVQGILDLVARYFDMTFDEESLNYYRFVTHLKFFAQRMFKKSVFTSKGDNQLFFIVQEKYPISFKCALEVQKYVKQKYDYELNNDEMLYLTIHIEQIRKK
jgi:beta-glucoside operon transcriptional antiterminator